jgi:hypothetical protein
VTTRQQMATAAAEQERVIAALLLLGTGRAADRHQEMHGTQNSAPVRRWLALGVPNIRVCLVPEVAMSLMVA